ncbi:ATP-binding protein [Enterococcus casseliflavus]|uniref:ATP-binding protein n=1 Tax=Enterococcus casseliflavus TaxID=37734 RepID=UPI0018841615|nr:ATP-binding protein [Enterococcus casseliflavus]MBE9908983.1 hypothetical protein [Enterococcus casseliflavus]
MARLSVSGKIIEEVSHNIPGTKYAIIELIKNSYEARANSVVINVSPTKIVIVDDGKGMGSEEIDILLTVSDSNKTFGQEVEGRLISGEKGLGFFSAFKFGNVINVSTIKNGVKSTFELNMKQISYQKNLYHLDIPVIEAQVDDNEIGTIITISEMYEDTFSLFKESLDKDSDLVRLSNVIDDPEFNIEIKKSWSKENNKIYPKSKLENAKTAIALFDSTTEKNSKNKYLFKIIRNDNEYMFPIHEKYNQLLDNESLSLKINIDVYNLQGLSRKNIPIIYHDSPRNRVIPIIYINNCLFDNYTMYNPEINAAKSNTDVFRQQTGKIDLLLRKPGIISFNSDRTQMTESLNSKLFQQFLDYFSSEMQISLRKVLVEEEEKKPKIFYRRCFVNEVPNLENESYNLISIFKNGTKQDSVSTNKLGEWQLIYSNGDKVNLSVVERPDPTIKQIKNEFIVAREYSFDELFSFRDCENGIKIKPLSFNVTPLDCRSLNQGNRTLTFNKPCERIVFKLSIEDKISHKILNAEYIGKSVFPTSPKNSSGNVPIEIIHPLMNIEQNVKPDLFEFRNQLNELYRKSNEYELVFISALRTFIELTINDIVEKLGMNNDKELQKNFKTISNIENIKTRFIDLIENDREKAGISTIYKQAITEGRYNSTVEYLNLTTHAAGRIISLKQIESDFPIINLIYTYLCFLTK